MQWETYHSISLLLDPVDIIIPYVDQFLYFMYIKFIILYNLSGFLIYLQKKVWLILNLTSI